MATAARTSSNRSMSSHTPSALGKNVLRPAGTTTSTSSAVAEVTDISLEHGHAFPTLQDSTFTVIGCNAMGLIGGQKGTANHYVVGCSSYCAGVNNTSDGAPCAGMGCCEPAIPSNLTTFEIIFATNQSKVWDFNPCFYAMVVEIGWYNFKRRDLVGSLGFIKDRAQRGAPVIADWAIRNGSCPEKGKDMPNDYACISANSYCMATKNGPGTRVPMPVLQRI